MLATIVESVTTILTFAGIFYYIAAMWSARSFVRRRAELAPLKATEGLNGPPSEGLSGTPAGSGASSGHPEFAPAVSILKPVKGLDPGMYEAFASHCRQEYAGEYEVLFGVSGLDDSAVAAIERLQAEFPERSIRLIECPEKLGPNGKMGNVVQLAREARYDYLLVNDSDIRVGRRYLARIMAEFAVQGRGSRGQGAEHSFPLKPTPGLNGAPPSVPTQANSGLKWATRRAEHSSPLKPTAGLNGAPSSAPTQADTGLEWGIRPVGLVTAPYRGRANPLKPTAGLNGAPSAKSGPTLGSKLEALGIAADFFPGVLVSLKLDGEIRFGLGSTLAVSREALDAIGGFAPLVDSLADDYELGNRIAQAGFAVVLSREIVETSVPAYTLAGYFAHQLRWARGIRDSRKAGYLGLIFTFGLAWAMLNAMASGFAIESLALLSLTCLARVTVALAVGVGILGDRQVLRDLWLLPVRDLAALWVWVWSFAGNTVTWRGETYTLEKGKLKAVDPQ